MSFGERGNFSRTTHRKLTGREMSTALAIREDLLRELPPLVQQLPESAKIIAFKTGTTPRCIEGARQGEHLFSLHVALALGKKYKPIRDLFNRLMDAETGDSGENPIRVAHELQALADRILAGQVIK